MRYKFEIKSLSPLLMHANNIQARDVIQKKRKESKGGTKGDDRSPPDTWKSYLYHDGNQLVIPLENILAMLIKGGAKIKAQGRETLKTYAPLIDFEQQDIPLLVNGSPIPYKPLMAIDGDFDNHIECVEKTGFALDVRPCSIGTSSHVRVRPFFGRWSLLGTFEINESREVLTKDNLKMLFDVCGRRIGLGDWRPSSPKPGRFGRFTADVTQL